MDMAYIFIIVIGIFATTLGTLDGGGLISLPMMLLMGVPIHSAVATNKVSNTFSSFSSNENFFRQKYVANR